MIGAIIINNKYGLAQKKIDHKTSRLTEEFSKLDVEIDVIKNDGHLFKLVNGELVSNIKPYNFIIYLDKDIYTAVSLKKLGYRLFTDPSFIALCDDKLLTHISISGLGIPTPNIISAPLSFYKEDEDIDNDFINKVIDQLGLPAIFKTVHGSLGQGVELLNSKEEALLTYRKYKGTPCFFQQYVDSLSSSIRVLVLDKKIVTIICRKNESDFRSNSVNGNGHSYLYSPSDELLEDVKKLIEYFDIEYAGIDFIVDEKGNHYFLEMNSNAFFSEAEKVSNINIAALIANYLIHQK